MEFDPNLYKLSQERVAVEREVLSLAIPNVGLHGTSSYRDGLIEISRKYDPQQMTGSTPDFTYYALIDPQRMKKYKVHPLFFTYTLMWARTFAQKAVRIDRENGISSQPVLRVMTNMKPINVMEDFRVGEDRNLLLADFEAMEDHHGLYERTIGKIDDFDYDIDENIIEYDTRVLQKLVPILLRPQSPRQV